MNARRDFLKLGASVFAGVMLNRFMLFGNQLAPVSAPRQYSGTNFAGWEVALGDGIYARPGEAPVSLADIETIHTRYYSELRANIQRRIIMAHNITFKRIIDPEAKNFIHTCSYEFRLPYIPTPSLLAKLNAQTLEGGIFIWDGANTRLDYGIAFQWGLNPWKDFGALRTWSDTNGGEWINVGKIKPDTRWHQIKMTVDFPREVSTLLIDNRPYPAAFTRITKPPDWGNEVAARLQAEIISIDPEPSGIRAAHKAQFRNWKWNWATF